MKWVYSIKWESLRDWLVKNEIIFKTVVSLALSVSAILISVFQYNNSKSQKEIAVLQEAIAEAQAMPQFEIAIHKKMTGSDEFYDTAYLEIVNNGGPVYQFRANVAYFLDMQVCNNDVPIKQVEMKFPINGYFGVQMLSPASKGILTTFFDKDNSRYHFNLFKDIMQRSKDRGWAYANTNEKVYAVVYYIDMLRREHVEYYSVKFIGSAERLSEDEGKKIFSEWKNSDHRELSSLKANDLLDEIAKKF